MPLKDIKRHLIELDSARLDIAQKRIQALIDLHVAEMKVLHPKDPHLTELDRKTSLQAYTAELRKEYEIYLALEELVKERVQLGILLLKRS